MNSISISGSHNKNAFFQSCLGADRRQFFTVKPSIKSRNKSHTHWLLSQYGLHSTDLPYLSYCIFN